MADKREKPAPLATGTGFGMDCLAASPAPVFTPSHHDLQALIGALRGHVAKLGGDA